MYTISGNDIFARVLSAEDIIINRGNFETASFNTKTRVLSLPVFPNKVPDTIEEMFISHEVGHALWTNANPGSDYTKAIKSATNPGVMKGYLNILEDVRIEKLMKTRYPGLRKTFARGYEDIVNTELFDLVKKAKENAADYHLIDRINLFFKFGHVIDVPFSEEERELLPQIFGMNTAGDVIAMAKKLMAQEANQANTDTHETSGNGKPGDSEGEESDKKSSSKPSKNSGDKSKPESKSKSEADGGEDSDSGTSSETGDESEDSSGNPEAGSSADSDQDADGADAAGSGSTSQKSSNFNSTENDGSSSDQDANGQEESSNSDSQTSNSNAENADNSGNAPAAESDQDFNKAFGDLAGEVSGNTNSLFVGEKSPGSTIVGYQEFYKGLRASDDTIEHLYKNTSKDQQFAKNTKKMVAMLAQEYDMKKAADQMSRAKQSKTGQLDIKKLYAYKTKKEIFREMTVVPDGKNHGMVMVLDWSGSMNYILSDAVRQVLALVEFCRRVDMPYRVYIAKQNHARDGNQEVTEQYSSAKSKIFEIFSNEMSFREHNHAKKVFANNNTVRAVVNRYKLDNTPIASAVLKISSFIMADFIKRYNIQKPCFVVVTDGEDNAGFAMKEGHGLGMNSTYNGIGTRRYYGSADDTTIITDSKTKVQYCLNQKYGNTSVGGHAALDLSVRILKDRFNNIPVAVFNIMESANKDRLAAVAHAFNVESNVPKLDVKQKAAVYKEFKKSNSVMIKGLGNCFDGLIFVRFPKNKAIQGDGQLVVDKDKKVTAKVLSKALIKDVNTQKENRFLLSRFVQLFV